MSIFRMIVMDVDGTLTDGKIYISSHGEIMKAFCVKDGLGISKILEKGITPVIITGRESEMVKLRASELKITEVYQGVHNKAEILKQIITKYQYSLSEVAYIGDDENDIEIMNMCAYKGCPSDAVDEVKKLSNYVCINKGGDGAVREYIEYLLKYFSA